jgi:glutathione S-transferase
MAFAKEWVVRGTQTLEKMLERTAGKFCFGDEITAADMCLYPHAIGGAARFGLDLKEYPNVNRVIENLKQN